MKSLKEKPERIKKKLLFYRCRIDPQCPRSLQTGSRSSLAYENHENTTLNISIKTLAGIAALIFTLVGMWFTLQGDIAEAKKLPLPPDPEVTRMEFDMKDQLIRQTIMTTQEDVKEIKNQMIRMENKIDNLK